MSTDVLERVRMCLAEVGHDPDMAVWNLDEVRFRIGHGIPQFTAWRALAVAGAARSCWPCARQRGWAPPGRSWPACGHPIDPFCAEDAEAAA